MPARLRKFIGLFGILGFLMVYVVGVITVGQFIPSHWAAQTAFFAVAGVLWGVPLFPLISWMNRGK